jgi:hypothetical protein
VAELQAEGVSIAKIAVQLNAKATASALLHWRTGPGFRLGRPSGRR